jgi:hypothetical protein
MLGDRRWQHCCAWIESRSLRFSPPLPLSLECRPSLITGLDQFRISLGEKATIVKALPTCKGFTDVLAIRMYIRFVELIHQYSASLSSSFKSNRLSYFPFASKVYSRKYADMLCLSAILCTTCNMCAGHDNRQKVH